MYGNEQRQKDLEVKIAKLIDRLSGVDDQLDDEDDDSKVSKLQRQKEKLLGRWDVYKKELESLSETEKTATISSTEYEKGEGHNNARSQTSKQPKRQRGLPPDAAAVLASILVQFAKIWVADDDSESE